MEICLREHNDAFLALFTRCETVIAYRSTPKQKAVRFLFLLLQKTMRGKTPSGKVEAGKTQRTGMMQRGKETKTSNDCVCFFLQLAVKLVKTAMNTTCLAIGDGVSPGERHETQTGRNSDKGTDETHK